MNHKSAPSDKNFFDFFKQILKTDSRSAIPNPKNNFRRWSGPRPDQRDPKLLGEVADKLAQEKGWETALTAEQIISWWPEVVGKDIASHTNVTNISKQTLFIKTTSTAWATQLRLMQTQIINKINQKVGSPVVRMLKITGPTTTSWRKGPRHVSGRGPRDTYG